MNGGEPQGGRVRNPPLRMRQGGLEPASATDGGLVRGEWGLGSCPVSGTGQPLNRNGGWDGSWGVLLGQAEAFADYLVELARGFAAFAFFFEAFAFVGVVAGASGVVEYGCVPGGGGV